MKLFPEVGGISKSGKTWRKREAIVEYEHGQYPRSIVFQIMGDNIDKLNIQQGLEYELEIDFDSREWNGRYFLQASCWKATPLQQPQQAQQAPWGAAPEAPAPQGWTTGYDEPPY